MEDFKPYLTDDSEEERRAAEFLHEGFDALRLERKVSEVAAARQAFLRRRFWSKIAALAAALLVVGALFFYFFNQKKAAPVVPQQEQVLPQVIENQKTESEVLPETKPSEQTEPANQNSKIQPQKTETQPQKNKPEPIAKHPETDFEKKYKRQIAPTVRGENRTDPARQKLLDQIWITDYPPMGMNFNEQFADVDKLLQSRAFSGAYVRLQRLERTLPANDTLIFMKAFCLLEMGEGEAALSNFDQLQGRQVAWQPSVRWLRGLAFLLAGKDDEALDLFRKIAGSDGDPFQDAAQRAVELLE